MSERILIRIKADTTTFVYNDLTARGMAAIAASADTLRASHVEPSGMGWTADMSPVSGPKLGPYPQREEALAAERVWLQENMGL